MTRLSNEQLKEITLDKLHKLQCTMQFFNIELGKLEDYIELDKLDREMLIAFYIHLGIAYEQVEFHYEVFEDVDNYFKEHGDEMNDISNM